MTKVYIKYNPYKVETDILINGDPVQAPNKLADFQKERLQVWVESLLPTLDEICNDDEYVIDFYGTALDHNDLLEYVKEYCEKNKATKVNVNFTEAKGSEDRLSELKKLFDDMQRTCPFDDLKTDQIKENFQSAIGSDFEVNVIATMSSGKSTLINALLGRELMPSKNEACTATISKIKDVDNMDHFEATYYDGDKNIIGNYPDMSLEDMAKMNDNPNTAYIYIKGNVPNIESQGVQLVLVDTPGPNNSRTEDHKAHTYRIIKEKAKPMVLYVLNATQLQTNDDKELLSAVSEAMKVGGKQSKDRFLFAVNKVDLFDPDKESVQGAIENVKEYLKKFDIESPNIFPTSAELAKVIRMSSCGQKLTRAQNKTLGDYDFFIDEEKLHLSEQATLSKANMEKIQQMLKEARDKGDTKGEALVHTGVPAIELAIDEYLKKYAYTTKVKTAVDTFKKKVEEKDMHAKMIAAIQKDENARIKINQQLALLKKQLDNGDSAIKYKERIQNLNMMSDATKRITMLRAKISDTFRKPVDRTTYTALEAQQLLMKMNNAASNLQSDVKTELENIINDVIVDGAQQFLSEYREHMYELIDSGAMDSDEYSSSVNLKFLTTDIPDAQEMIDAYKYEEKYDTGETEWIENTNKKWYKPWTWFQESGHRSAIYANREMVDLETLYDDFVTPILVNLNENIDGAKATAEKESEKFKAYFIKELEKLEGKLKEKVQENEKLTRDRASVDERIAQEKANVEWLNNFNNSLDKILTI